MSGWKYPGWQQPSNLRPEQRWIATSALIALCTLAPFSPSVAQAQDAGNRITDISVSPNGELVIQVEGEGFDPMLRLEAAPNGEYRIVVQGQGVSLSPELNQATAHLGSDLSGKIPAIDKTMLSGSKTSDGGFQLVLTAWRKLQPQVLSNNGNQIVITLIGDHSIPAAVSQQRKLAEQQRIAVSQKQEALKKQAERQRELALQHQEDLKKQTELALQAKQAEQQRLAENKKKLAAQHIARLQKEAEQRLLAESKRKENAQHLAQIRQEAKQHRFANLKQIAAQHPTRSQEEVVRHFAEMQAQEIAQAQAQAQSSPASDEDDFAALKRQEAKRLAKQQRLALAHKGELPPSTQSLAITPAAKAPATTGHAPNQKQMAVATTANKNASSAPKAGPATKPAEWQNAYVATKPLSTDELLTELQVAQQTGKPSSIKNLTQAVMPATAQTAQTAQPQTVPVNFNGTTGEPAEDDTPTDPLRLKKLPANYTPPEPDPDAAPAETPMNFQPSPSTPTQGAAGRTPSSQKQTKPPGSPTTPVSPGANGRAVNTIYAVINQPNADPSLRQAWQFLMSGDARAAQATLRQHLQSTPDDANARYLLAEILLSPLLENPSASPTEAAQSYANRREEARRELLRNYAQSLHWPSCQALLELFLDEGKLEEATRLLAQVKQAYPNEAGVPYEQGRLQEALNDMNAARAAYQTALGLQPANPEIHYRLAQVELKSGHLEAARWELLQALTWSPNDGRLYKLLGYIADKTGQGQQAAKAYRQALPVDALINYARTLEAQNQPEHALSLYQAVEALAGDNGDILYSLAMIYTNNHHPSRAAAMLTRFIALDSAQRDARTTKAKSLLKQLDHQK